MLGPGLLAHVVAQAADTRYKYHPGWADTSHHLRVVAGARRQPARGQRKVTCGRLHQRDDIGRKRDRLEACEIADRDRYAPITGEPSKRVGKLPLRGLELRLIGVAQVDGEHRTFRDHIHEIRIELDAADRALLIAANLLCQAMHQRDDLARNQRRIVPQMHRRRAGMAGAAGDGDLGPDHSGDTFDRSDGAVFVLEDRTLLDVRFEVSMWSEPAGLGAAGVADALEFVPHAPSVDPADRVGVRERNTTNIGQAAHRIWRKARAFLVGESDERQRPAGDVAHIVQGLTYFKPGQDSIEAVIATASRDCVDMRPEHHRRGVRTARADADDVANGVDCDGKRELAHPFNEQIAPGAILVAECEATIAAARQGTDTVEGRKPFEQPITVDPRRCCHLMSSLCEWWSTEERSTDQTTEPLRTVKTLRRFIAANGLTTIYHTVTKLIKGPSDARFTPKTDIRRRKTALRRPFRNGSV